MTSYNISRLSSANISAYQQSGQTAKGPATRSVQPANREGELSQQLEQRLNQHLSRIRQQIAPQSNTGSTNTQGVGGGLDIRA